MIKKLKNELNHIIISNLKGYLLVLGVFLSGVALSYMINISSGAEGEIKHYIDDFVLSVKNYSTDSESTFSTAMISYIKGVGILLCMSLSVAGSVGALIYVFVKGFSYGIVFGTMFGVMSIDALKLLLCLFLPHSIVMIPCFLMYSLFCIKNAYLISKGVKDIKSRIVMPIVYALIATSVLSVSALIQAYFEPLLTRIII